MFLDAIFSFNCIQSQKLILYFQSINFYLSLMYFQSTPYRPSLLFNSGHFNTIVTNLWRYRQLTVDYHRKRINTPDGDFLDLDFSSVGSQHAIVLVHGLEGDAYSAYMKGMTRAANHSGWDTVSINLRGCSGELNRKPVTYHSGKTEDLATAVEYLRDSSSYEKMVLTGFSLGANLILKYAGEVRNNLPDQVKALAGVCVPFALEHIALNMDKTSNRFYQNRFLKTLKKNALRKITQYPDLGINRSDILNCRNFYQFDDAFTAPVNGFDSAETYWRKCSCQKFLRGIICPALMINSLDDPFIGKEPIPFDEVGRYENLYLIAPEYGGHVGFGNWNLSSILWHEQQVINFCQGILN